MKISIGRRTLQLAGVAAIAASSLALTSGNAYAYNPTYIGLSTSHAVGVYASPTSNSAKVSDNLYPGTGDGINAMCWVVGQSIGNYGDVWYDTVDAFYDYGTGAGDAHFADGTAWTFAPYVDGARAFHNGLPECPSSIPG